jgi:hyperosmotically inducible periplasmic protein
MNNPRTLATTLTLAASIASLALVAACSPSTDTRTAGEKLDATLAKAEHKADEVKADVSEAGKAAIESTEKGADTAAGTVKDMRITTEVKARLVADPALSALAIDVDTQGGRVQLRGSAPSAASRDNAAVLAAGVDGVASVDNQLVVKATKS